MQAKARQVQRLGLGGNIQAGQDAGNLRHVLGRQPPFVLPLEELLQSLVAEAGDHMRSVTSHYRMAIG
jgi:hypothetical protein